jgi:hypothetical protein
MLTRYSSRLALALLASVAVCAVRVAKADFSELVAGIGQVVSPGAPGPVHPMSDAWAAIVGGDEDTSFPATFAMARQYYTGRVVVFGHDGLPGNFGLLDNGTFLLNVVEWLRNAGTRSLAYTTGHSEWIGGGTLEGLRQALLPLGYGVGPLAAPITSSQLGGCRVLIVGNAWGSFTPAEIESVRLWVEQGGGAWLVGCGWSWEPYHPGTTIEDYPMMKMAQPYDARWLRGVISDPTNNLDGSPVFHTFYPNAESLGLGDATAFIDETHAAYTTGLLSALESDPVLRRRFVHAHQALAIVASEYPPNHSERQAVFDYYAGLAGREPSSYARQAAFDQNSYPTSTWLRERAWRTWHDCVALTPDSKAIMATLGALSGRYLDVFDQFDVLLMDNMRLDAQQREFVYIYLANVPPDLHALRAISVKDFLGNPPLAIPLEGSTQAVNVFGVPIGGYSENSFPSDVPPGIVDGFCVVVAHEVNHVVDVHTVGASSALRARRDQLISTAGNEPLNYLRSMLPTGFFVNNPQEFFASVANQWFTDSVKTIELGISRFDGGRPDPINQALFFADVYSGGGNTTYLYTLNTSGVLTRHVASILRNGDGLIQTLTLPKGRYVFTLDGAGRVTGYEFNAFVRGDLNCSGALDLMDVEPFVTALIDPVGYALMYPACYRELADMNQDAVIDGLDIQAFVNLLLDN